MSRRVIHRSCAARCRVHRMRRRAGCRPACCPRKGDADLIARDHLRIWMACTSFHSYTVMLRPFIARSTTTQKRHARTGPRDARIQISVHQTLSESTYPALPVTVSRIPRRGSHQQHIAPQYLSRLSLRRSALSHSSRQANECNARHKHHHCGEQQRRMRGEIRRGGAKQQRTRKQREILHLVTERIHCAPLRLSRHLCGHIHGSLSLGRRPGG